MEKRDINLLPKEVVVKRKEKAQKKTVNFFATVFFAGCGILSLLVFLYSLFLSQSAKGVLSAVAREEQKINDLRLLEADARRLGVKSDLLSSIFEGKKRYSLLLDVLAQLIPSGVRITSLVTAPTGEVQVAGITDSYVLLSHLLLNILDPQMGGTIFSSVDLNSVSLDERVGGARFLTTLYLKGGSLLWVSQ